MGAAPAFMERARSAARFTTWLTLMPGAGSNSYEVMTGPGFTWTMRPSTPKSWSFFRRMSALAWSSSCVWRGSGAGGTLRGAGGGRWWGGDRRARGCALHDGGRRDQGQLGLGRLGPRGRLAPADRTEETRVGLLGQEKKPDRDGGQEHQGRPDGAHRAAEHFEHAPAEDASLVDQRGRGAGQEARDGPGG